MGFWRDYDGDPLKVLVVCTGNICRSPLTEFLLDERFAAAGLPARVTSAGTGALVGEGMTPQIAELARGFGVADRVHSARQVDAAMLADADVVLTATRAHRALTVEVLPRSVRHTFTVREFARLAGAAQAEGFALDDAETPAAMIAAVAALRGFLPPLPDASDDDIVDPYRRSTEVHAEAGRLIDEATRTIVSVLADPRIDVAA